MNSNIRPIPTLFEVFETNLLRVTDDNLRRERFIHRTVQEYLSALRKSNVVVPAHLEASVAEELGEQVSHMLLKKTYGFSSILEYQTAQKVAPEPERSTAIRGRPRS